jgi:hypothetical protein
LLLSAANFLLFAPDGAGQPDSKPAPFGYTPSQIRHAYGFDQIRFQSGVIGDGTGQTIAIIDSFDNPRFVDSTSPEFSNSDLHRFDVQFGLSDPPSFRKLDQNGGTHLPGVDPQGAWEFEESLDVEWIHALAPGADIILFEANSDSNDDQLLGAAATAARTPGVSIVSLSFGGTEFPTEASFDAAFRDAPPGVTFVSSSGDSGAPGQYQAYSPYILAVGGTTLKIDGAGNYVGETGWSGSGGGISQYEPQPFYQVLVSQSMSQRTNPDVAFDADPSTGVAIYDSYNFPATRPWARVGGTSFSAPAWSALLAIVNQGRIDNGLSVLDGFTETLPALYALPASDFHPITQGNNGFPAAPGYDLVTGLGSPYADRIVADLTTLDLNPVALDHSYRTPVNTALVVSAPGLLEGAIDLDDDTLSVKTFTQPQHGTVAVNPNGSFTYTPDTGFVGADTFLYQIQDDLGSSDFAIVTIQVFNPPGPADHLLFLVQPSDTIAGDFIAPDVEIEIVDATGNRVTTDNSPVTLTLSAPSGGVLSGTTTVAAEQGIATFADLSIRKAGTYAMVAKDDTLEVATSTAFTISPGTADHLLFLEQPTNTAAGQAIAPAVQVGLFDAFGNLADSYRVFVTVALDHNQGGASLSGITTVRSEDGIATFAGLSVSKPGTYTLAAVRAALPSASSCAFSVSAAPVRLWAAGASAGGGPEVKVFDGVTNRLRLDFLAYDAQFTGGVRVAVGDVNGDGFPDIVTGAGPGGGPNVEVFSGQDGALLRSFFAFDPNFTGGVFVAAGDANGDGFADIIVGADAGGGPNVVVVDGRNGNSLSSFFAFDAGFTGGVRVAAGDLDGDGAAELLVAAGPGGGPQVRAFNGATGQLLPGPLGSVFVFDVAFTGGVYVAAADLNGDGRAEIVVGAGAGGGPDVKVINGVTGVPVGDFMALNSSFTGGVRVSRVFSNQAGRTNLVAGAGPGAGPTVTVFDGLTLTQIDSFFAFDPRFAGGVFVG